MKKIICCCLLALSTFAFANDKPYSRYIDLNTIGGYPLVGIGVRSRNGVHGMDFSGSVLPIMPRDLSFATFHVKGLYLYYPTQKGFYLGGGIGLVNLRENLPRLSGSAESTLGYQWEVSAKSMIFFEANAITPFEKPDGVARIWPGISFGFGF